MEFWQVRGDSHHFAVSSTFPPIEMLKLYEAKNLSFLIATLAAIGLLERERPGFRWAGRWATRVSIPAPGDQKELSDGCAVLRWSLIRIVSTETMLSRVGLVSRCCR